MVTTEPAVYTKHRAIRPGFESVSQQHAAHAHQRFYSISSRVFLEHVKIEQAKERLCWQGDVYGDKCVILCGDSPYKPAKNKKQRT